MRRKLAIVILLLLLAAAGGLYWYTRPLPILTVTTWPGEYGRAQAVALMQPYAAAKRVNVRIALWDGELDELRRAVKTDVTKGDVFDFELPKAVQACNKGLLEKIDPAMLPPGADGVAAKDDFVPSAIGPCWVGSVVYARVIVFQAGKSWFGAPAKTADIFDLAKYPGPRALVGSSPKFNLELALLADGVAPSQIYPELSTASGLARAYAKLETLKGHLVWLDFAAEAIAAVTSGRAVFATADNGDVAAQSRKGFAAGLIADRPLYELDVFGVPRGDPDLARALDFIAAATATARLAAVADWVPYAPARRSAWPLVGANPDSHADMRRIMPLTRANAAGAFAIDDAWWAAHAAALLPRWRDFTASH